MKKVNLIGIIILFIIVGCKQSESQNDEIITINVTGSYPMKELILQDFMDVEYIPLETNDEFVCEGFLQDIGKEIVIVINRNGDGDIFIFNRNGKALRKINRKGQGGEEYTDILGITLDEDKGEIFVNNIYNRKILVYDLYGNFKRSLKVTEDFMYDKIYNFDEDHLICHDAMDDNSTHLSLINNGHSFVIISKQDGSITNEIQIPFKEKKSIVMKFKDEDSGMTYAYMPSTVHSIVPYFNDYIPVEFSADTMYKYSSDHTLKPFIVRTPPVQSMVPEVFLFLSVLTDHYYFMETIKKEDGFPGNNLLYDRQKKALFKYTVYNSDYSNEEQVYMKSGPVNSKIPSTLILEAPQLVEDYERGRLKGRLKEIAVNLDEESNPVIMLMKYKK